jgi:hypothetical protein
MLKPAIPSRDAAAAVGLTRLRSAAVAAAATTSSYDRQAGMKLLSIFRIRSPMRNRNQLWVVDMASRHCWFRVLLHLACMIRRWRNRRWHWRHIVHEFYGSRSSR